MREITHSETKVSGLKHGTLSEFGGVIIGVPCGKVTDIYTQKQLDKARVRLQAYWAEDSGNGKNFWDEWGDLCQ